jgi:hypothetical protein
MTAKELKRLAQVLTPLPGADDATGEPPPSDSRFGLRLKLSGVHWVRPEVVVVDVTYSTWTEDNLPVAGLASQGATRENDDVAVGLALAHCLYPAFMLTSSRHLSSGTDDSPAAGRFGRSLYCWAGLALVGCWH